MVLLLFLTFIFSTAFADIHYGEISYPDQVQLDYLFRPEVPVQQGGSCHVFAATALLEATCYQILGEHIDISEAYLFNRHLSTDLTDEKKLNEYLNDDTKDDFGKVEAGWPEVTIQRALNHSVCGESEFPLDRNFVKDLEMIASSLRYHYLDVKKKIHETKFVAETKQGKIEITPAPRGSEREMVIKIMSRDFHADAAENWKRQIQDIEYSLFSNLVNRGVLEHARKQYDFHSKRHQEIKGELDQLLKGKEANIKQQLMSKLEAQVKQHAGEHGKHAHSGGLSMTTGDSKILQCLKRPMEARVVWNPSQEYMISLLATGIPFICENKFQFPNGISGQHASTVIGYKYNPRMENKIEYRLRDSNEKAPTWGWNLNCQKVVFIQKK